MSKGEIGDSSLEVDLEGEDGCLFSNRGGAGDVLFCRCL